jgi:hypothetical protein
MKYTTREIEDPKGYIFLEISFEVDLHIINRNEEDINYDLFVEEKKLIIDWIQKQNEFIVKDYELTDYKVDFKEGYNDKIEMSFIIEVPPIKMTILELRNIILYLSETDSLKRSSVILRDNEVFIKCIH